MAVLPNSRGPAHSGAHEWQRQLLPPAIGRCIVLSKLRCLVTLVSFVLLVSDIPRTGLGVKRLADFYGASVLPGSAVRFGPYAYPVAHIVQPANDSGSSAFTGSKDAKPIEATRVWSYKYDSTSIGLRGAVELLNVSAFPATLLYKDEDASNQASTLDLGTTFSMLDAFISSARAQLLLDVDVTLATWRLATKSLWIDRLQYYVTSFFATNTVWRLHSIHVPATIDQTKVFNICPVTGTAAASRSRPCFCDHVVPWLCTNPLNASLPSVPLWRHLGLRLQGLQRRYPNVSLEMALLSSQKFAVSSGAMQSTYYNTETIEIVMLSRGRRCIDDGTSSELQCTTVFVDDYRYESDIVQTDLEDWFGIIASLRSSAQCYVWIRLALLFYGAFVAADGSPSVVSRLQTATAIVLRVPFQVVVYGSALPVVAYVLAHLLDSSFMDIFLEAHWSSVGGTNSDFSLVRFLNSTAVQMRNVWLLALLTNVLVSVSRRNPFDSNEGVLGIRGLAISFTAMLSIFGPYKDPSFRNSVNTVVLRLADRGQRMETIKARPLPYLNTSPYCFDTSMTMMILSIGVAVVLASVGSKSERTPAFVKMAAIRSPAPLRYGASLAAVSEENATSSRSRRQSARSEARARTHDWQKLVLRPDIAGCIRFSKLRCLITVISLVLLATDIPRSGLGVRCLNDFYPVPVLPSTAVRFGPFEYPVGHIWRLNDSGSNDSMGVPTFRGLEGLDPVDTAHVWSYKYDSTSVGLRGAVELLNVSDFPPFLLYKGKTAQEADQKSTLDLATTFFMLDAFMSIAKAQLQPGIADSNGMSRTTLRFATKHNWVDRLHHYLIRFFTKSTIWSLHSLHVPSISRETRSPAFCLMTSSSTARSPPPPHFCNHPAIWDCQHPLNASLPPVRVWEHVDLRFQDLQQRYPGLVLDVVLLSTHRPASTTGALRLTFYNCEEQEIVVLTRGRRCVDDGAISVSKTAECTTVFVDDYRYERDMLQTNAVDWYPIIATMRGGAQSYFWVRLLLLLYGSYTATAKKPQSSSRLLSVISIVFNIPFQVIVYSSPLPIAGYVMALLLDSSFMDIFLDAYWAAVDGATNFQLVPFFQSTAVQMRNVWLLALFVNLLVALARKTRDDSSEGVFGIRGLAISFVSTLTVFGPYRRITFRDASITSVFRLAEDGQTMNVVQSEPTEFVNATSYVFDDSMTMLLLCIALVTALGILAKALGYWLSWTNEEVILSSTPIVPCGTGILWPTSPLSIRFYVRTQPLSTHNSTYAPRPSIIKRSLPTFKLPISPLRGPHVNECRVAPSLTTAATSHIPLVDLTTSSSLRKKRWPLSTRVLPGDSKTPTIVKRVKSPPGGLRSRTTEAQSILQLMNIAMMTDPWNLFWLRVLGVQLYLYKVRRAQSIAGGIGSSSRASYAVILPYREDEMEERTGLSPGDYQLLDSASSRDVPMIILLQCG
ncbi:hypothetical protein BBJ28_00003969 [Nothophytophthora sp. Chile5]|nr:hypothetical protein BBJ28_00003969 [Nothophytophthora sp. Chile5]